MSKLLERENWVIMTKDRKRIAAGNGRDRSICDVEDVTERILTYRSEGKARQARQAYTNHGFYGMKDDEEYEPVRVKMTLEEI